MMGEFKDPSGNEYTLFFDNQYVIAGTNGYTPGSYAVYLNMGVIYMFITRNKECSGGSVNNIDAPNRYAIQVPLEGGGVYCVDG